MHFITIFVGVALIFSLLAFAATPISNCMHLSAPGQYELTNDLTGASVPTQSVGGTTCIRISSSNTQLDCKGYKIVNDGSGRYGILLESIDNKPLNNVVVHNCQVSGYTNNGLFSPKTTNSVFTNITAYDNQAEGILVWETSNSLIANNTVYRNKNKGIYISLGSSNNKLLNNTVYRNGHNGITLWGSSNVVMGNVVYENQGSGIFVIVGSEGNTVTANIAYKNLGAGFVYESAETENKNLKGINIDYGNQDPDVFNPGATGAEKENRAPSNRSIAKGLQDLNKKSSQLLCPWASVFLIILIFGAVIIRGRSARKF